MDGYAGNDIDHLAGWLDRLEEGDRVSAFGELLMATLKIFDYSFVFEGFTISYWKIFLWMIVALAFIKVVFYWLNGE